MDYQSRMLQLVKTISDILALGFPKEWGQPSDVFDSLHEQPSIPMRFLHYGPVALQYKNQFGMADHTDFGCISVLLQEEGTVGLKVYHPPTDSWIPVPVITDAFVMNMGDMIVHRGYYRSARHRVLTNREKHRHSIAFFFSSNLKLKTKPLDGFGAETVVGEHIRQRLIGTMGSTRSVLQDPQTS